MPGRPPGHRRSIRLPKYDYTLPGAYFITICTQDRSCLFGSIADGEMHPSPGGDMVRAIWEEVPSHYPGIRTDAFVVMPNHIHGVIVITPVGAGPCARPRTPWSPNRERPHETGQSPTGQPQGGAPTMSLPDVVHRFKTLTTKRYADGVKQHGWPPFPGRLWQRNYYEHIVRDERELALICDYIEANPTRWAEDPENPSAEPSP